MKSYLKFSCPVFKSKAKDHQYNKGKILEYVYSNEDPSVIDSDVNIKSCDWKESNSAREYLTYSYDAITPHLSGICSKLGFNKWQVKEHWYQLYGENGYHGWHVHGNCMYTGVYYVSLTSKQPTIEFLWLGEIHSLDIEEGDIICFPSFLYHRAPLNKFKQDKIITSFNIDFSEGLGVQNISGGQ